MAIAASAGIALGLLGVALLAVTAGARGAQQKAPGPRAILAGGLTYLVVLVPLLSAGGLDLATVALLIIGVCLPIAVSTLASRRAGLATPADPTALGAGATLVVVGLVAVLLVAAGQALSLLGRVSPVVAMTAVAVVAALIGIANGLPGTARAGRWLFWVLVGLAVPILAAGAYLGRPADLVTPVVPVTTLPVAGFLALAVGLGALGILDPALRGYLSASRPRSPWWAIALLAGLMLVLGIGLLLVYGGSLVAPSLAFFILPANLGALPGGTLVGLSILTFLLAACVAGLLAGAGAALSPRASGQQPAAFVAGLALGGLGLALLPVRSEFLLLATMLAAVAASTVVLLPGRGSEASGRQWRHQRLGLLAGLAVAAIGLGVVVATGAPAFGATSLLVLVVTAAAAGLVPRVTG